jgi:CDP-2,3-bis-(O-geranylgeranyl)-sn-glycerol synthase
VDSILFALWFFLPAGLANASPVFFSKLPGLKNFDTPLDLNRTYKGKPIFGTNKTWRGLIGGTIIGALTAGVLQQLLQDNFAWARAISADINYSSWTAVVLGGLLGAGALLGDAIESFFKRRVGVKPGHPWFPFDQTDYIIGGLLLSLLVVQLENHMYWVILLVWTGIHLIASYVGYHLKLKDKPI